jgi:hypothetical protein
MMPKNGSSWISVPQGSRAVWRWMSMVDDRGVVELVGQGALQGADGGKAPALVQGDIEDVDLQHVAGFGALYMDRAGQHMGGGAGGAFLQRLDLGWAYQ